MMRKFTGMQYLQIDIASNYGLDKKTWDERLTWFEQHKDCLHEMLATAETPALFYAGVKAYEAAVQGIATGYPVSLDATSSGLQILAALTGDRSAAALCNVIDTGRREDAYTGVYTAMVEAIGEEGKIKREDTKQAIMTSLYGSKAVPKEVFGEGPLLQIFYATMKEKAPAAWELNEAFLDIWNPEALCNSWVLPDNFHVHVKVMNQVKETVHFLNEPFDTFRTVNAPVAEGRSLGANTIHSIDGMIVREMNRRCNYDTTVVQRVWNALDGVGEAGTDEDDELVLKLWNYFKASGYLSARILDHLRVDNIDLVDAVEIRELLM
ncbi:DNA-directed RNA polymerase, partial [Paraburkholderia sp. SIMBA_049]